ncbi:cohesin loading factor domain-containing protein [Ditylenchus destructor]|uniref:MAU2 chromatid cohesion factor homolog n=1 Tax=Ditylenchus destructor TaxID=166010 RepID=A0AAD4NGK6_9BILA|nr:cohesin loading factor domain-containing protein [Ditylenchus destructor]
MDHSGDAENIAPACYVPPPGINPDEAVVSLMAMAECFRTTKPPKYKMAIKCVMAALKIQCSQQLLALCHYELGKLLWLYTRNSKLARFHLKNAYNMMKDLGQPLEFARLKVVCFICEIYIAERRCGEIKDLLRNESQDSRKYAFIHAKVLFLLAEVYLKLNEFDNALELMDSGIAYFRGMKEIVVECYLRLTKSLILAIQMTNQQELGNSVSELGEILQRVSNTVPAINDIRAFCYSIQLCYFLSTGMLKSSKQCLRQLHQTVQAAENPANQSAENRPHFQWLSTKMLTGLAYVLTVLSNIQYSNLDRAHRYYTTALQHFDGLKSLMRKSSWEIVGRGHEEMIGRMEMLLYESMAQTQLVIGNPQESLNNIAYMVKRVEGSPLLFSDFEAQTHTLLGMYAFYMRQPNDAEKQFKSALQKSSDTELFTTINLNLALVYLFTARESDFYELFDHIAPAKLKILAPSLKSAAHLVHGVHYYLNMRAQECKNHLMDSISISKEEDMARIQAMALLLLSKLFKSRDTDVLKAGLEWATKSNDISLVSWANSQIIQLHSMNGQVQEATSVKEATAAQQEKVERARQACTQMQAHRLVQWIDGCPEAFV